MNSTTYEEKPISSTPHESIPSLWIRGLIGLAGGIVGGMVGGGGGIIMIPALDHTTTLSRARIHGTSTLVNAVIAVIGAGIYSWRGGTMDLRIGIALMCGGLIGAPLGAHLTARLPERLLRLLFLGVLLVTGAQMLLNAAFSRSQAPSLFPGSPLTDLILIVLLAFLLGVLIGAWSSSMGMGGGILTIPVLVLIFGVNQHTAAGTSLLVMIPNTLVGSYMHLRQRTASLRLGSIMGIGAFFGAAIGIWIAFMMNDQFLQLIFGCFVLVVAMREGYGFFL
jgi:uncharacterized membrane protein YfcA